MLVDCSMNKTIVVHIRNDSEHEETIPFVVCNKKNIEK